MTETLNNYKNLFLKAMEINCLAELLGEKRLENS
jgi:hypothetical protein